MDVHISYGIADKLLTLAAVLFQLAVLALIAYGVSYVVVRLFRLERTKRTLGKVFVPCLAAVFLGLVVWVQHPIGLLPSGITAALHPGDAAGGGGPAKGLCVFPIFYGEDHRERYPGGRCGNDRIALSLCLGQR